MARTCLSDQTVSDDQAPFNIPLACSWALTISITRQGFVGFTSSHIKHLPAQILVLPYGVQAPIVLKPYSKTRDWKFVDFACVHGIMNREPLDIDACTQSTFMTREFSVL